MLSNSEPELTGSERAKNSRAMRELATEAGRLRPHALTRGNDEEADHYPAVPANFTKGLAHDDYGIVDDALDYQRFMRATNAHESGLFDSDVDTAKTRGSGPDVIVTPDGGTPAPPSWRGWESPRAGLCFDLEGPDAGAVGMAPSPRLSSSELAAEMAEVYGMALLRDVPFTAWDEASPSTIDGGTPQRTPGQIVGDLNSMPFFTGTDRRSSTPQFSNGSGMNSFERSRREARTGGDVDGAVEIANLFRGSTPGALRGPYISQFLMAGNDGRTGPQGGIPSYPAKATDFDAEDGYIVFGTQIIDQRVMVAATGLDHMTDWASWLDVQRGYDLRGLDRFESERRFITTPRDLATYVHFDALYQAYLNACLLLLGAGAPFDSGMPEPSATGSRTPFATFGGPHVLTLVTEIATRCLKAVRRQKFNFHRRARPEAIGGRVTLAGNFVDGADADQPESPLGPAAGDVTRLLDELPPALLDAISAHNAAQNDAAVHAQRQIDISGFTPPTGLPTIEAANHLLPMAFPEGSPMHPAYGAGHATVAGGCVTVLKAFFEMFDADGEKPLRLSDTLADDHYFEVSADGSKLVNRTGETLTIQGELDKLAANISIGRNMAGVHYYSDYFDSLRMGERVAVGMLMEQLPLYGEPVSMSFTSFDGDFIEIAGEPESLPTLSVRDADGERVDADDWWLRHAYGEDAAH
ncbi:MAG: bromoperoxidase [Actinomycetota bacterium]